MSVTRLLRIALIVSPLFLGACAADGGSHGFTGRLQARITGVGDESAVVGRTAFVQIEAIRVKEKRLIAKEIDEGDAVETKSMVRVDIDQVVAGRSYNYNVIMAPPAGSGADARGWVTEMIPSYEVGEGDSPAPAFYLDTSGGLIAWGYWPYFSDRWVSAGAIGTTIALETDSVSKSSYVYLLPKSATEDPAHKVTITCLANTGRTVDIVNDTIDKTLFVEIKECATTATWPPAINPILPGSTRESFVNRMTDAMAAAAW